MDDVVIVSACRTAIGKYGKSLSGFKATELGSIVVKEAVNRAGIAPTDVQECIMGNVLSAGLGQNPARQAAVGAGLPVEIGSFTVNMVCGSGLKSMMLASDAIKAGQYGCIVAGGMESMSNAPYLLQGARFGYRMGDQKVVDSMVHDGLWDIFSDQHMGITSEIVAERYNVTREDADLLSVQSHQKAARAQADGKFDREIVPVTIHDRKKGDWVFDKDEGIRADSTMETLGKLKPAFKKDGISTAGNSSQLSDGASACVLASRKWAEEHGVKPLASVVAYGERGVEPQLIMEAPIPTTRAVLKMAGMTIDDIDIFEHNEAFATASCAVKKELNVPDEKFNVHGGAVALGHPIGCSGARIMTTILNTLEQEKKDVGLGTLCLGGGNAVTMIVRRERSRIETRGPPGPPFRYFLHVRANAHHMQISELLEMIEASRDDMARDMIEMVGVPSISPETGGTGESARADLLMTKLQGFDSVERVDIPHRKDPSVIRSSILAKKNGKRKGTVWVIAHIDTVPAGDLSKWETDPFKGVRKGDRVYGRGTEDNGQSVISSLYAAKYIDKGTLEGMSIGIAWVADEEMASLEGSIPLIERGYFGPDDLVLVPDWGSPGGSMVEIGEKGLIWLRVDVKGKSVHASTPEKGINAFEAGAVAMRDVLADLRAAFPDTDDRFMPPGSTFVPTEAPATVANVNTIPGDWFFCIDCRVLPVHSVDEVLEVARKAAERASSETGATVTVSEIQRHVSGGSSPTDTPGYAALADAVESVTGKRPVAVGVGGGTVANFFRAKGRCAYVWQTGGGTLHGPNEYVELDNLICDAKVFATLFYRLCVKGRADVRASCPASDYTSIQSSRIFRMFLLSSGS